MKEQLLEKIKNNFDLSANLGVVFSGFSNNKLVFEKGIIFTDEKLQENIEKLYSELVEKNKIDLLVVDIVRKIEEIKTAQELQNIDLLNEGVFIGDVKTDAGSFILPDTKGINNIKQVVSIIKEKVEFSGKNINVYKFTTKRFVISK